MGVWIETFKRQLRRKLLSVTPFVGVWIETGCPKCQSWVYRSHPSWVCGLKLTKSVCSANLCCHTLRGCVDWNFMSIDKKLLAEMVTPFVGVWIETSETDIGLIALIRHTLRGCVDWNWNGWIYWAYLYVTPFVGVWIETILSRRKQQIKKSHPSWVCGLKQATGR